MPEDDLRQDLAWMSDSKVHSANMPMQYAAILKGCKNVFFAQYIERGYTFEPPQSSNYNLSFRAKIRK